MSPLERTRWVVEYPGLTGNQKAVLHTLAHYAGDGSERGRTAAKLADQSGMSERTFRRCIRELENKGLVRTIRHVRANEYRVSFRPSPVKMTGPVKMTDNQPVKMTDPTGQNDRSHPVKLTAPTGQNDRMLVTGQNGTLTGQNTTGGVCVLPSISPGLSWAETVDEFCQVNPTYPSFRKYARSNVKQKSLTVLKTLWESWKPKPGEKAKLTDPSEDWGEVGLGVSPEEWLQ